MNKKTLTLLASALFSVAELSAQIVLIGDNPPNKVMNDGDFSAEWKNWRLGVQSPFWRTVSSKVDQKTNDKSIGMHYGKMFCSSPNGVTESKLLNTNLEYQTPKKGDKLHWSFDGDLEYISKGTLTFALVFGDHERVLAERVKLIGSDMKYESFSGVYTLNKEDENGGLPFIRVRFYSDDQTKVYLDNVTIWVENESKTPPILSGEVRGDKIHLSWNDPKGRKSYALYSMLDPRRGYTLISKGEGSEFTHDKFVMGRDYQYVVTCEDSMCVSGASNVVTLKCKDSTPPKSPTNVKSTVYDSEVKLEWSRPNDPDFASYSVVRSDVDGKNKKVIATGLTKTTFEDILAPKSVDNKYVIYAHDFSGNRSEPSEAVVARVNIVLGASFSDLILPMPIGKNGLTSDTWGADGVRPRDIENGAESPDWSYWGGRPVYDKSDGKYHMNIARWPESALKGHWEWPRSTVAHVVSDTPIGPYREKRAAAYDFKNGLGHNPDVIFLNDGRFALYSLISWEPTIFTAETMNGPWKREGVLTVDSKEINPKGENDYQYLRNLSGVQLEDGRVIMVTKFGAMMVSDNGLLGPYKVVTDRVKFNKTVPDRYRHWNYEDPVMWRDSVQYHLLINAFIAKRAIYMRSGDGINWVFDPGLAYTPDNTIYENGLVSKWDKLERPHILQDEFGRAIQLSVAVIDVDKGLDYGADNHNSKNMMIPLLKHKRLQLLNKRGIDASTKSIELLIISEEGFDAQSDIDLSTLRFGSAKEVNYGRGSAAIKSSKSGKDLKISFTGADTGITEDDFAYKLLGRTKQGELVIGYVK